MSSYTTTIWERIKDYNNREPDDIMKLIEKYRDKIFNFSYETPSKADTASFKKWFETAFITKFLTYEIGSETFELFQIRLASTCLRIMPIYARIIDNIISIYPNDFKHGQYGTVDRNNEGNSKTTGGTDTMGSTLPANMIASNTISDVRYADNSSKTESESKNTSDFKEHTDYDLTYFTDFTGLFKFNKESLDIYNRLFDEFEYLFLGVL